MTGSLVPSRSHRLQHVDNGRDRKEFFLPFVLTVCSIPLLYAMALLIVYLGDLVLERADTAIWLDVPLRVSVARMWKRTSRRIRTKRSRGEHATWNLDHLRWLQWEARSHLRRRVKMKRRLARHARLTVVHLKSQSQIDLWLARQPEAKLRAKIR